MASGTPGGDWRHGTGGKRSEPARGTSRRSWQPGADEPRKSTGRRRSRTGRFILAGLVAGLILALIVVLIEWWRPGRYPNLVVVAPNAPGSLALAENVAGKNTAVALDEWARAGGDRPKPAAAPADIADRDAWKSRIDPDARSVVLYFSAHGGADPEGPYLWFVPADAGAPANAHKLRVREVLDRLAGLPKGQPKLLIFDATAVPASWPHGALTNDFARALKELDGEIAKIDGLVVICASDDEQRSWVSEEWRQTVFGHYLIEGLKGASGNPGDRITAEGLFQYVKEEVRRWVAANRDEKQTPVLLPRDAGPERAAKLELAAVPGAGYPKPADPEPPAKVVEDSALGNAWKTAAQLADRVPAPDTTDPATWRDYLDLLVRWERLERQGDVPELLRGRSRQLAELLRTGPVLAEPLCLPAALPVGRALGFPPVERTADAFRKLWDPSSGSTRTDEWNRLLGAERQGETARRLAAAEWVLDRVAKDGPTAETLKTADEVLGVVDGSRVGPAEAHFLRMLHRHLDAKARPPVELLRLAVRLRIEAEEAAWVGGIGPEAYPYAEQVFRWTRGHVEKGGTARELGQDLLFDTEPKSWDTAGAKYFAEARDHYRKAREDAAVVATALAARDRVLARLPYYARWLAAYRGRPGAGLQTGDVEMLLASAEAAARAAHRINELAADVPAEPAARLKELAAAGAEATREFGKIVKAFEAEVRGFTNVAHPSNWHALDHALGVPFIPARDRVKLLGFVRDVSYQLAQPMPKDLAPAPSPAAQEMAKRQGRMAVAVLGERSPELRQLIDLPKQGAWWESYRDAGERIGRKLRALSDEARAETAKAATVPLRDAAPHLGRAAYLARLADPAAPVTGDDPTAAEQRYWQHYFLLGQAGRTLSAGWADVAQGSPDQWYCRKAAKLYLDTAAELVRGADPNLPPAELERRLADVEAARKLTPTVFTLTAPKSRELADEPGWEYGFELIPSGGTGIGFPVRWITSPGPPYNVVPPKEGLRVAEPRFVGGEKTVRDRAGFAAIPRAEDVTQPGRLTTTVLYRGHRYEAVTDIRLAGTPTLDWRYLPPRGTAAFAVLADKDLVAGSVTILIDLTSSMKDSRVDDDVNSPTRLQAAKKGLELVLKELRPGTIVTLASFHGTGQKNETRPLSGHVKIENTNDSREQLWRAVKDLEANGENTPLAGAIGEVLAKSRTEEFWPKQFTGSRTLIVLTDGEDNWGPVYGDPGNHALRALKATPDDVNLHVVFFGMGSKAGRQEEEAALKQFEVLTRPEHFREPPRTPARLWAGVRDSKSLAERVTQAMVPVVGFQRVPEAGGAGQFGRVPVTIPRQGGDQGEGFYKPTPPLKYGVYDLWGLRTPQKLQLATGDRVLLRARQQGDSFDLAIPPLAFETADRLNLPRETTNGPGGGGVYLTIPEVTVEGKVGHCHLKMTATLEPVGGSRPGELQQVPRPLFAWFDVAYADGKPAEPGLRRGLVVVNRGGAEKQDGARLAVPAWDLTATQWDVNRSKTRRPAVSAYWVENPPDPVAKYPIELANPEQSAGRLPKVVGAELISVTVEEMADPEFAAGKYLTVRLKYAEPGKPVFLRPGKLKGPEQRSLLTERHLYWDGLGRYTARFGPLTPDDLKGAVDLELFPVAELKDRARNTGREVTIRFRDDAALPDIRLPDELRLEPARQQ